MREDEMVGWHHRLNGHGFGWTLGVGDGQGGLACCGSWGVAVVHGSSWELLWFMGVGDGQGGLACCGSWGRKESDRIERLN